MTILKTRQEVVDAITTVIVTEETAITVYAQIPAWDAHYILLPGSYPVETQEYCAGHPFPVINANVRVVDESTPTLFCGNRHDSGVSNEGMLKTIEISVAKLPMDLLNAQ